MSRARAIETRLEKLLPSLEEYFTSGFLTRAETQEVARQRTHWEYRLVAKPLLVLDVRNAIAYELGLEKRLREYCVATGLVLRHRWTVLERIESIYRIGLKHLRDATVWEQLRRDLVIFLKDNERHAGLSALYGELLAAHPMRGALWAEAVLYEGIERENADGGRAIAQQALISAGAQPNVWAAAFALEMHFADRCLRRIAADMKDKSSSCSLSVVDPVAALREENAALASIVFDASLAIAVATEALASPASGLDLARRLIDEAARFPHGANVASAVAVIAMNAARTKPWSETALVAFTKEFVRLDVTLAERGVRGDAVAVLRGAPMPKNIICARAASISCAMALFCCQKAAAVSVRRAIASAVVSLFSEMTNARGDITKLCTILLERGTCEPTESVLLLHVTDNAETAAEITRGPCERVRNIFSTDNSENTLRPTKRARSDSNESDALCALWRAEGIARFIKDSTTSTSTSTSTSTIDDIDALLTALRSGSNANETIDHFLNARGLPPLTQLRYGPTAPAALWRVFACLEQHSDHLTPIHNKQKKKDKQEEDSEDSDEEEGSDEEMNDCAALGLKFLATAPCADAERCDGISELLALRIRRALGLRETITELSIDTLRNTLRTGGPKVISRLSECLRTAMRGALLPRAAIAKVALPALEAIAIESGSAQSIRNARAAHESIVSLRGMDGSASECAERSAADWAALVAFERGIAKDLKRAKEAAARARREAVDPQRILAVLNAQI